MSEQHYSITENNGDGTYDCKDCGDVHPLRVTVCPLLPSPIAPYQDAIWQTESESMPISERTEKFRQLGHVQEKRRETL